MMIRCMYCMYVCVKIFSHTCVVLVHTDIFLCFQSVSQDVPHTCYLCLHECVYVHTENIT
jgi:hypothetical protein